MNVQPTLLSLQGYLRFGPRLPSGKPGALFWAGNVPELTLSLEAQSATKNESHTGARLPMGRLALGKSGSLTGNFDQWSAKNMALGLYGEQLAVTSGSASAEEFPAALVVGDQVRLARPYATSVVLTDSAGTPATVDTANYRVIGHNGAIVEILNLASYVQPFKAAYSYAAYKSMEAFTKVSQEVYAIFDGINTETGEGVLIDMYRLQMNPFTNIGLIHQEYGQLPFTGALLFDPLNVDSNGKGGFLKIINKTPV